MFALIATLIVITLAVVAVPVVLIATKRHLETKRYAAARAALAARYAR